MKYINMKNASLFEKVEDVIGLDPDSSPDMSMLKVNFDIKDIVLLKGYYFERLSNFSKEVELNGYKKYKGDFLKYIVSDTDINTLSHFMSRDMYENIDLTAIIRYMDIKPMVDLINSKKIKDLRKGKKSFISNIFNKNKKACILFINYETRERVFEYVEYDSEKNDDFFLDYSKKDFIPALILEEKEVLKIEKEFIYLSEKDFLSSGDNLFINPRSMTKRKLTEQEEEYIWNVAFKAKKILEEIIDEIKNDSNLNKEEKKSGIKSIKNTALKDLQNEVDKIKRNNNIILDDFPEITFDYLTLGRNNKDKIISLFENINKICNKNKEILLNKNLSEYIDI